MAGKATKGHFYVCATCGLRRQFIGALVAHVRTEHNRNVSKPEYTAVTERQAAAVSQFVNRLRD